MFSYRSLLKQAWVISWRHKYLWFFGLFASLTAASGSIEYQVITQNFSQSVLDGSSSNLSSLVAINEFFKNLGLSLANLFHSDILVILNTLSLLLVTLTLIAVLVWLAIASQAALVDDVKKLLNPKKKAAILSPRNGLTTGTKHFWPVFGLNILIEVLVKAAFFFISLPLLFMVLSDTSALMIAFTIVFVIFLPVAVSLSLLVKYAIAYQVLENESFVSALEKGWKLFWKNWLINLEMAIILFIISFLVGLAALVVMSLILLPLLLLGLIMKTIFLVIAIFILGLIIVVLTGSFLTTFQISAWTSLFLHLKDKGGRAKLERLFERAK